MGSTLDITLQPEREQMSDGEMKHHLVSQVLLKQWCTQSHTHEAYCYNISKCKVEQLGTQGIGYKYEKLHPSDRYIFEELWQKTENEAGSILCCINNNTNIAFLKDSWDDTLKDLLAIHLIRSFAYVKNYRERFSLEINNYDPSNIPCTTIPKHEYTNLLKNKLENSSYYPDAMEEIYPHLKKIIAAKRCALYRIPESLKDSTFLIGDCPVLPLTISKGQPALARRMFGPDVATYFFPIGPKVSVQLSNITSEQEVSIEVIELLNELQIRNAEYEIIWDINSQHHLESVKRIRGKRV